MWKGEEKGGGGKWTTLQKGGGGEGGTQPPSPPPSLLLSFLFLCGKFRCRRVTHTHIHPYHPISITIVTVLQKKITKKKLSSILSLTILCLLGQDLQSIRSLFQVMPTGPTLSILISLMAIFLTVGSSSVSRNFFIATTLDTVEKDWGKLLVDPYCTPNQCWHR